MFTAPERLEWVEIIEPRSHERMYANLQTGECVWEPPPGVAIKRCHGDQWWELFDSKTSRFYYYNVSSQQTVWHRPANVDIIPLAKLQTLKQTTDIIPRDADGESRHQVKEEMTQTSHPVQFVASKPKCDYVNIQKISPLRQMLSEGSSGSKGEDCPPILFKEDSTKSLYIHSTTTSPTVSRKHLHCHHHSHTSDGEMPVASSGAVSHRFAPVASRSSHSSQSNSGIYGYVYRDPILSIPQRSLESPRACEVLLDLDRSKPRDLRAPEAQRGLDLMSRSYHSHYHSAYLYRPDVSPSDAEKSSDVGRRSGTSSYGNMPDVLAAQATPRQKPRAFPRTNPTFVGVQRMDGYSTYRRINERTASSMSAGSAPKFYDAAVVTDPIYNRTSIQMPSLQDYPGYPTLRQKRFMNHSFDVADPYNNHPFDFDRNPDGGAGQLTSQQMSLLSSVTSGDSTLVAPARMKSRLAAVGLQNDESQLRRNSEPFYVNVPVRDREPVSISSNGTTDTSTDTLKCNSKNARDSLELQMKVAETCSNGEDVLENVGGVEAGGGGGGGGGDDGYSDRSSVFSSTPPVKAPSVGQSPAWIRPEFLSHPDYPQKSLVSEWLERGPEDGRQTPIFDGQLFRGQKLLRQLQPIKFYSESDGDGQHFVRPSEPSPVSRDIDTELHSLTEFDIEEFATKHLNDHRKGFLGKLLPVESVLTWSKEAIKKPLIRTPNKTVKKEAPEILRKIQLYMGDRTMKGVTAEQALLDVIIKGWSLVELRDEIFIQLCRQTTKNPIEASLRHGFEMLCICLSFFPPSYMFLPYLQMHLNIPFECSSMSSQGMSSQSTANQILVCRKHCQRRLEKVLQTGAKKGLCKPTVEEVEHARKSIYATSMFGSTLSEVMVMQSSRFPNHRLPWIQTVLSELVLRLNGARTEGIFRVPGDIDEVNSLKVQIDTWNTPVNCKDPSVPASLLKLWYRELYEPLIPYEFYFECIDCYADPDGAFSIVNKLPTINKNVLLYLVRFLQVFAAPENVIVTKMDINNLSMVMAPNFLRCRLTDPKIVFENARKEMGFVRTLIQHLDTNEMEGIV